MGVLGLKDEGRDEEKRQMNDAANRVERVAVEYISFRRRLEVRRDK